MALPTRSTIAPHANAQTDAYEALKAWILHGPLQPGEVIRDVDVAQLLGVSRTPVREAIIRLAAEGLVESRRGYGTRVSNLGLDRAPHLFAVSGVLDAMAAERAASRLTAADRAALTKTLAAMDETRDPKALNRLDESLHRVYYARAGNPVLMEMLASINQELARIERHAWGHAHVRAEASAEHHALVDALLRGDAAAAGAAARQNCAASWDRIELMLRGDPADPPSDGALAGA